MVMSGMPLEASALSRLKLSPVRVESSLGPPFFTASTSTWMLLIVHRISRLSYAANARASRTQRSLHLPEPGLRI